MSKSFNDMCDEAYELLEQYDKSGTSLILPNIIVEMSTTRLHWKNVKDFLKTVNREPEHFMDFLINELPGKQINWFSASKADGLLVHAKKFKQNDVSELALKYVNNYVSCPSCKHFETDMIWTPEIRKYNFVCQDCGFNKYLI